MRTTSRVAGTIAAGAVAFGTYVGGGTPAEAASAPGDITASSTQTFKNQAHGGCMDDKGGKLWQRTCNGSNVQKWDVFHKDGNAILTNTSTGDCVIDTYQGLGTSSSCNYPHKQKEFRVYHWNDGTISFQSMLTRECIDVDSDGDIGTRTCDKSKSQSWY